MMIRGAVIAAAVAGAALTASPVGALQQHHAGSSGRRESYSVSAVRVDQAPRLDGVLDDDDWKRAEPSGLVATEMRRDADRLLDEDNFQVILDTFNDSRNGYMFVTTPLGGKLEQQITEEGEGNTRRGQNNSNVNRNWDGVWEVAARITHDGWTAEIAIPLTTLRFPDAPEQTWGINFMRNIRRKNEQAFWSPIPKAYGLTRVSLAGTLSDDLPQVEFPELLQDVTHLRRAGRANCSGRPPISRAGLGPATAEF